LLGRLFVAAGLPFFLISSSAPLLQRWFASTDHAAAGDPYFLYAGSNLGSPIGLVGYPLLIEPAFTGADQRRLWIAGYGVLSRDRRSSSMRVSSTKMVSWRCTFPIDTWTSNRSPPIWRAPRA
jgi:hypothetical protein